MRNEFTKTNSVGVFTHHYRSNVVMEARMMEALTMPVELPQGLSCLVSLVIIIIIIIKIESAVQGWKSVRTLSI